MCATVKIEIRQELTLERQAFDAHMRINNGLSHIPLQNVAVDVHFADEQGNPVPASSDSESTSALFFIRVDTMQNIGNVTGSGTVAPEMSADIHWLIIPNPGASNGREAGTLYFVGATLTYTAGGKSERIEVTPDFIYVKPMPQLVLDYFMPTDVYGNDPWTSTIESPVPFELGLRIRNQGHGVARSLKVESAQPRIVENELDLLIGFRIDGTSVNGRPAVNSLLADFGDIAPEKAGVARWIMTCTLSGRIVGFEAEFSHAAELGGKLTSLIGQDDVRTHFLVHSVLVDAEGRDNIEDFLAKDDDVYRVYESDNIDTLVTDQSGGAGLANQVGGGYRLTTPPTDGFMYAQVPDPARGAMVIREATRSDGKRIKPQNVWFSKTRAGSGPWQYFLNIFDHNTTGAYTIVMQSVADMPRPPEIQFIPDRTGIEGQQLSFLVEATASNGTTPVLITGPLPVGATFVDRQDGSGIFNWVPASGQAGRYSLQFFAADGLLEASRQAAIQILSPHDTDGDGLPDSWELEHFGTLDRDGNGDFDGDGISDLDEYLNGFDPTTPSSVPSVPVILAPLDELFVDTLTPELVIAGGVDPEEDPIIYTFELFADLAFKEMLFSGTVDGSEAGTAHWSVPAPLVDNAMYYWRVRASNATGSSLWAYGRFFVDTENDPPTAPGISAPTHGNDVDRSRPVLEITNARDPEGETVTYDFEIYADEAMTTLVTAVRALGAGDDHRTSWAVDTELAEGSAYHWRAVATDSRGAATPSPPATFWVNTANSAPAAPLLVHPEAGARIAETHVDLTVTPGGEANGQEIAFIFELDTDPTFSSAAKIVSDTLPSTASHTRWSHDALAENTWYFWRVKSSRGTIESPWTTGSFFVNTRNEEPERPELRNPGIGAWVTTATPVLSVHPARDPDQDVVFYRFELFTDPELSRPIAHGVSDTQAWHDLSPLNASAWYYWRAQAVDNHGLPGEWSETGTFFAKVHGPRQPPQLSFIAPASPLHTNAQGIIVRWHHTDPDGDATIALYYTTDAGGTDGVLIAANLEDDPDGRVGYHTWDVSQLEGTYYIHAVIANAAANVTVHCPAAVTIDRTPPAADATPPGGLFEAPVQVTLAADKEAAIYYTLDGSAPDIGSPTYDDGSALAIEADTTLRFMAIDTVGNQSEIFTETYTFTEVPIAVTVTTGSGSFLAGVAVTAFTESGDATGLTATTEAGGQAHFEPAAFSAGIYRFRADHLGQPFWSTTVTLPDTRTIPIIVDQAAVTVTVQDVQGPAAGVSVHLFNDTGNPLGLFLTTNRLGQVVFDLPVGGTFQFRADIDAGSYWSSTVSITGDDQNVTVASGGRLEVTVSQSAQAPLTGIPVRLFNADGADMALQGETDHAGSVVFHLPVGDYRARIDYMGHHFWSEPIHLAGDSNIAVLLPHHAVELTVLGQFQEALQPLEAIDVHLFSVTGDDLGIGQTSDDQGRVIFDLPDAVFMARADTLGGPFWSDEFTWEDPVIRVPMAEARITVTAAGQPLAGVVVTLFDAVDTELGLTATTDAAGQCLFRLPEGSYRFRAAYMDDTFWSGIATLAADQIRPIGISTGGGGAFTFSVWQAPGQPLAGITCALFDDNGNDLERHGITDADGQVVFDLENGRYRLRVNHLGHPFWSQVIQVPIQTAAEITIPHELVDMLVVQTAGPGALDSGTGGCGNTGTTPGTLPSPNVRVYLLSADRIYEGPYRTTDDQGRVQFHLPVGAAYVFRADMFGSQYWSDPLAVSADGPAEITLHAGGGRIEFLLQDGNGNPASGVSVHLHTGDGTDLDYYRVTNGEGRAFFDLPGGNYLLRFDYAGQTHWTDPIEDLDEYTLISRRIGPVNPGGCGATP
ncbi:MAG: chitobiase/beta-hexosaminidase C-terminal domain-containing protein [Desulfatitalea sp.]|nr:chitobiase/beta-hexosaminidase C-terminal domain-containing protein [Desulfatitalea sp.]